MGLNFLWGILIPLQGCFLPLQRRWCHEVFRGRIDGWDELEGGDMFFVRRYTKYTKKATELELKFKNSFREPNL